MRCVSRRSALPRCELDFRISGPLQKRNEMEKRDRRSHSTTAVQLSRTPLPPLYTVSKRGGAPTVARAADQQRQRAQRRRGSASSASSSYPLLEERRSRTRTLTRRPRRGAKRGTKRPAERIEGQGTPCRFCWEGSEVTGQPGEPAIAIQSQCGRRRRRALGAMTTPETAFQARRLRAGFESRARSASIEAISARRIGPNSLETSRDGRAGPDGRPPSACETVSSKLPKEETEGLSLTADEFVSADAIVSFSAAWRALFRRYQLAREIPSLSHGFAFESALSRGVAPFSALFRF